MATPAAPTAPAPQSAEAERLAGRLSKIQHVIIVLSGKGGVGKSVVTSTLAKELAAKGKRVGVLDCDVTGPSMPHLLGVADKPVHQCSDGWVPVFADEKQRLSVMSIGFLLDSNTDAVVWRGPKKTAMIQQFLSDVSWGELDYLLIDTPPGTSDEHLTIVDCLRTQRPDGAILVTTPQGLSLQDVMREATFCRRTSLPLLGLVENMSGFVCPHCAECTPILSSGGGRRLAERLKIPFLGAIPIDPSKAAVASAMQPIAEAMLALPPR